jgi:hypothetical protein
MKYACNNSPDGAVPPVHVLSHCCYSCGQACSPSATEERICQGPTSETADSEHISHIACITSDNLQCISGSYTCAVR